MLERESHDSGWQVSLRANGFGRLLVAGFLCFWLCGWVAGELFALSALLPGLRDLVASGVALSWLPPLGRQTAHTPPPVLAFLTLWLTGWTLGGLFAMRQVLRTLVGVDLVRWDDAGIEVVERAGPFASRRRATWYDVCELQVRREVLMARDRAGIWRLTTLGTGEERRELGAWLATAWNSARGARAGDPPAPGQAPAGWVVAIAEDGREMLVADARHRRFGAAVAMAFALALGSGAAGAASHARAGGTWMAVAVMSVFVLFAAPVAAWLALGRVEIRPVPGSIRRVKRFLGNAWVRELSPVRLRLVSSRDSDGDERWDLVASGPEAKLTLASDLYLPGTARQIGLWLASRAGVELEGQPEVEACDRLAG